MDDRLDAGGVERRRRVHMRQKRDRRYVGRRCCRDRGQDRAVVGESHVLGPDAPQLIHEEPEQVVL